MSERYLYELDVRMDAMECEASLRSKRRIRQIELGKAVAHMDWQQVVVNGGPPCFFVEDGRFCFRAERWDGHITPGGCHDYVPLKELLESIA